jgi:hypothetical protein
MPNSKLAGPLVGVGGIVLIIAALAAREWWFLAAGCCFALYGATRWQQYRRCRRDSH